MDIFNDKIEPLLRSSGLSDTEFEKALGLPRSTVYDWRKKRSRSYRKYLPEIALKLNVTVGFLLSNEPLPDYFSSPHYEYGTHPLPPEVMRQLDCAKQELNSLIDNRKQKLVSLIQSTDFTLSQLDIIEHMIDYVCHNQQK